MRIAAGHLWLELSPAGGITALTEICTGLNRIHPEEPSDLVTIRLHGRETRLRPVRVAYLEAAGAGSGERLRLSFPGGVDVDVEVAERPRYTRMTVTAVRDAQGGNPVAVLSWGPMVTDLKDAPGEFIGIVREAGFSIGMLSLEPGTDMVTDPARRMVLTMARYLDDASGSVLEAEARDHTRDGFAPHGIRIHGEPGRTVVGSSIAIFGCATEDELDVVEEIELGEGLPHPVVGGRWLKRSTDMVRPSTWMFFRERDVDAAIEIARRIGALSLSCFHDMFSNWGHFDVDPDLWPSGMAGIRAAAERARAAGVRLVMYTLTTFLKPHPRLEPYLAPVPDDRLQVLGPATVLGAPVKADGDCLVLQNRSGLLDALRISVTFGIWLESHEENQVVRVGNEIVYYRSVREQDGALILEGCKRGLFHTKPVPHPAGATVVRLQLGEFRNFYPGTLDMQDEVADRIAEQALAGGFGQITFDGHESCLETGHGLYSRNRLTQRIYERCGDRIPVYTGSNLGNYDWHVISFIRWGEFELEKGFRGTMLDYRLIRQVQLARNLLPHGLGQYYPSDATLEDVEWVMARAAGWDAAVDFTIFPEVFARNPEREAIMDAIRLWNQAQREGAFTPEQKRGLRQTDRLYTLVRCAEGAWELTFLGRWRHPGLVMLPASGFDIVPAGRTSSVKPCSIDWSWTHNPGIFAKACLSDDLVWEAGCGEGAWSVTYPAADREESDGLLFVLRMSADATCGIRDLRISLDGRIAYTIPVVLEPGQYLSVAHDMPMAYVYNAAHEVVGEVPIRGCLTILTRVVRGRSCRIGIEAKPLVPGKTVKVVLNLRSQEQIKGPPGGGLTEQVLTEMNICREENAGKLKQEDSV